MQAIIPGGATNDEALLRLWLHNRSVHTQKAYINDVAKLLAVTGKTIRELTLSDLQSFADAIVGYAPSTQSRMIAAVKSVLAFAHETGYAPFNVGVAVRVPKRKDTLSERILTEAAVQRMLALETNTRNHLIIRLLYASGIRCAELCGLQWKDVVERGEAGQITVYGKGGKTRAILLTPATWDEMQQFRGEYGLEEPVFISRKRMPLDASQVRRIVKAAAKRAGLPATVSPHWLRHSHGTHALDRGSPISLVQATLGHANVATTGRYLHARPHDSSARYLPI
ncbi:MAG: tyrosine-type recombinase/integrase [Chloroflexota bacterium]|nr:tyrosine-type recombinase/integrase [Chloroflexota bacterium]